MLLAGSPSDYLLKVEFNLITEPFKLAIADITFSASIVKIRPKPVINNIFYIQTVRYQRISPAAE